MEDDQGSAQNPYWRNNGAIEILLRALRQVEQDVALLLAEDDSIIVRGKALVAQHIEPLALQDVRLEDALAQEVQTELLQLTGAIWELLGRLSANIRSANLMAAIDLEAAVNQFLFLHLSAPLVDSIDRLSVNAKLEVVHAVLGLPPFRGAHQYAAVGRVFDWRNAFAHGKVPGIPTRSLKENHLATFGREGVADPQRELADMLALQGDYIVARKHLRAIAKHAEIFSTLYDFSLVEGMVQRIKALRLTEFKDWSLSETERKHHMHGRSGERTGETEARPRYVITVEHAIEAATPEDARATLEARLVGLDRELTAREHGEAPARAAWAVRGVRAGDETAEGRGDGAGIADGAGG